MKTTANFYFPSLPDDPNINAYLMQLQLLLIEKISDIVDDLDELNSRIEALGG